MLSTDAKEKVEEVFQAYDRYIAKVFDPELPGWRIRGKAAMGFVAIATALAACGPVAIPKPIEASPTKPAVTLPVQTETKIPTVTKTPTESMTPTQTEVPSYATKAEHITDFTLVSSVEEAVKSKMARRTMTSPVTLDYDPVFSLNADQVAYLCTVGTSCANPEFIRVKDSVNGDDRWFIMLEVRNSGDTESKIMVLYIGGNGVGNDNRLAAQRNLDQFNKILASGKTLLLTINVSSWKFSNPAIIDIFAKYTPKQPSALAKMGNQDTLPDELSGAPLWVKGIDYL